MSGDSTKTSLWTDADVRIDWTAAAAGPSDAKTAYIAAWTLVGLLDGESGIEEERDEDTSEHFAWGGVLIKKTRSKHKRTIKFVALEDNDEVFKLINPGSTRGTPVTGLRTDIIKVPKYVDFGISFETKEGLVSRRRTVKRATIEEIGTIKASEEEPTVYEITVVLYPEADGTLYRDVVGPNV